jgi:hypothetical protein
VPHVRPSVRGTKTTGETRPQLSVELDRKSRVGGYHSTRPVVAALKVMKTPSPSNHFLLLSSRAADSLKKIGSEMTKLVHSAISKGETEGCPRSRF